MSDGTKQGSRRRSLLAAWLPVLAWMGLIFFLSAQPDLPRPPGGVLVLLLSSLAHVVEYGVLAVLVARALGPGPRAWPAALALVLLYALSDELHQAFVPGRTPDAWDIAADAAGALLALWAWTRLRARGKRRPVA